MDYVMQRSNVERMDLAVDRNESTVSSDQATREKLREKWDTWLNRINSKHRSGVSNSKHKASDICAILLDSISEARQHQCILKEFLESYLPSIAEHESAATVDNENLKRLGELVHKENPFSVKMWEEFKVVLHNYERVNEHLQRRRGARRLFKRTDKLFRVCSAVAMAVGAGLVLVPLTGALTLLTALLAGPLAITVPVQAFSVYRSLITSLRRWSSSTKLSRLSRLALGIFVVKHALQTMSLVVSQLNSEIEHNKNQMRFLLSHADDHGIGQDMWKELNRQQETFAALLNDLEENILCEWA